MSRSVPLAGRELTCPADPGGTLTAGEWSPVVPGYRTFDTRVRVGTGDRFWATATGALLRWAVKTRSGFGVADDGPVVRGDRRWVTARIGPVLVREPVEVVGVVQTGSRVGFAYGTLTGHPVSGEEAFLLDRTEDGTVHLTLRSLTGRSDTAPWSYLFPVLRVAQRVYRRRYLRALTED